MELTLGQHYNIREKPTVQPPIITQHTTVVVHSYEDSTNVNNSTIEPYKNRGLGRQKNAGEKSTSILPGIHDH